MVRVTQKVKASSLIETIVAMVIMVIVFTIAWLVILNVSQNKNAQQKIVAEQLAKEYIDSSIKSESFIDEETVKNDFILKRTIHYLNNNNKFVVITVFIVRNDNEKMCQRSQIFTLKND